MKRFIHLTVVALCLSLIGVARGITINRIGDDGDWSNASLWNPAQVPGALDDVVHDSPAINVVTYDAGVLPANQTINSFSGVAGGSRGLILSANMPLTITTDFTRSGSGSYLTELLATSSLTLGGTITRGDWILAENSVVNAGNIAMSSNTSWTLNGGTVDASGSITRTAGFNTFTINNNGVLDVGGSANFFEFTVNSGGAADIAAQLRSQTTLVDGGVVTAGSHATTSSEQFTIRNGANVTIINDMVIGVNSDLIYGDRSAGDAPNTLTSGGLDFSFIDSVFAKDAAATTPSLALTVSGDLNVVTDKLTMPDWDSSSVALTLDAAGSQNLEAFSTDFGGVWFGDYSCTRPWGELTVASGATVTVVDNNVNTFRSGYTQDALYVDGGVTVESGATLNLGSLVLYYTGTLTNNGTINGTTTSVIKRCYGDYDNDGDVDLDDFGVFAAAYKGAGVETDNAPVDADCGRDVDLDDFGTFAQNYGGSAVPCVPGGGGAEAGGGWTPDSLANWCLTYLPQSTCATFAQQLRQLAEEVPDPTEVQAMLQLAALLTE